jgi:dTDP-4-dehydrorhamnose reductase
VRIAVVGAHGQLAAAVVHECRERHDVIAFDRAALDVTDDKAVAAAMEQARPDAIVNGAAYNDVDGAEDHAVKALSVNAFAVRSLASAAAAVNASLVHYSTDFVFDGHASKPYVETDAPNPRSTYAASKLIGEWFAADAPRAYVLRVESNFGRAPSGPPPKGSVETILRALVEGRQARVFEDRTISPTYVIDGARATLALLERNTSPGLYHCVNSGRCTWLEFANEAARQLGVEPRLVPVRMADMKFRADRPLYCALSNDKLAAAGFVMPTWQDALARYIRDVTALMRELKS